jgi:hypothetical protein
LIQCADESNKEIEMRTNFEMTADDLNKLLSAMKPVQMIALQCGAPRSAQENANAAWAELGKKMNFDPMTVQPNGLGDRFFSAESIAIKHMQKPRVFRDGSAWCATMPDFIDLQQSKAGFGATPQEAIDDLKNS